MTVTLDADLLPMLDRISAVLSDYDPVTQQKILELATVRHALRMGDIASARAVAVGMHKHIESMEGLRRIGRLQRDDFENLPAVLRKVTEVQRFLGMTELHIPGRHTRDRPLGL